jgi:threonine/homoserine/homoserine lactone efflux protein
VLRSHFVHGVLINLTNPKSVMFAAVVLIVLFPPNLGLAEKALIVGNHLALEWVFYFCLTWLVSRPAVTRRYLKAKQLFDRCAAGVMAALGLRLLLSLR